MFTLLEKDSFNTILKTYKNIEEALYDLSFKAPESFMVGCLEDKTVYSITAFREKFGK